MTALLFRCQYKGMYEIGLSCINELIRFARLQGRVRLHSICRCDIDKLNTKSHTTIPGRASKCEMTLLRVLGFIFFTLSALDGLSSGFEMEFNGPQYISYDIRANRISTENTHVSLQFKTFHPSGVLIYSSGTQGDFITLELIQGKLRFAIDLGSTSSIAGKHEVIMGNQLADNRWHTVKVDRSKTALVVMLDSEERATTTPGSFVRLDLDKYVYVGGLDRSLESNFHGSRNTPNFIGCLKDVYFDYIDIVYGAKFNLMYYSTSTKELSFSCPSDKYHPVGFPSPQSHLRLSDPSLNNLTFSLSFRSYTANGIIAFRMSNHARVYIGLVAGTLELEVRIGVDPPIKISVGSNLDDGMWHDLSAGVDDRELWILLDDKPEVRHSNPRLAGLGNFRNQVYIGSGTQRTGFIGCMHNIRVNGARILPKKMTTGLIGVNVDQCNARSVCYPNPCQNGGQCKQYREQYSCECKGTFYHGNYCEIPLYRATCADYKALGVSEDSYCTVDADGKGPLGAFEVLCNVSDSKSAATVITHDKMKKQLVPHGASLHNGFYFHRITYHQADLASMRAVVHKSMRCRQYISFNCYKSTILNAPNGPATAQWLSLSGTLHSYWGGAPRDKYMCSCGLTGTCDNPRKLCNCDIGDAKWREDAGYLTDKSALPVTMLQFTDEADESMFTLGPLECFGTHERTTHQASIVQSACRPVNPPPTQPEPSHPPFVPTAWGSGGSKSPIPGSPTTATTVGPTLRPVRPNGGHVTVTTTISTHDNRTHVTSVVKHNVKNGSKTTIKSSISSDKSGVTVHSSISSKDKAGTSPTVEPPTVITYKWRNGSVAHVTRVTAYEYSEKFIILVVASVVALVLLAIVVVVLILRRSGRTYVNCIMCQRCRNKRSIPDIEIYRHSMNSESPDVLQLDEMRPTSMELGAYNVRSGKAVYHSVHQGGSVKKFVSFSTSTSNI